MAKYVCIAEHSDAKKTVNRRFPGKIATLDKARWWGRVYLKDSSNCTFLIFEDESGKFVGEMRHDVHGDPYYYPAKGGKYKVAPSGRLEKKLR